MIKNRNQVDHGISADDLNMYGTTPRDEVELTNLPERTKNTQRDHHIKSRKKVAP